MNFIRLALQHTRATLRENFVFLLLLATAHLVTNAAFTGFVSFAFNTLFLGSRIQPETIGLVASAPLTASLAVIITSVTFGTARPSRVLNRRFLGDWIPVTIIYAWFFFVAWYCRAHMPARMTWFINKQPWLTEYVAPDYLIIYLPWLLTLLGAVLATLSVPIFVSRRQAFWRHHAVIAPLIVLAMSALLMLTRQGYRLYTGDIDPYHWLPFPGYHPEGIAYDQILYSLLEIPFLIPASIVMTCLTASLLVAVDLDRGVKRSPVEA